MLNQKEIKRKLRAIGNIRKVTKAMEMMSSIRLQRSLRSLESSRAYSGELWQFLASVARTLKDQKTESLCLLTKRPVKRSLFVVLASDKGLCGMFNSRLLSEAWAAYSAAVLRSEKAEVITVGKKAAEYFRRKKTAPVRSYPGLTEENTAATAAAVTADCLRMFSGGSADEVVIIYNHFASTGRQDVSSFRLFPLQLEKLEYPGPVPVREAPMFGGDEERIYHITSFLFEPGEGEVLPALIARYSEMMAYETMLESFCSEHAARMVAMQKSTSSADELSGDLTVAYNKARQSMITSEIIEVINSAEALS